MIAHEEILKILKDIYQEKMPFNRMLGVRVSSLTFEKVCVHFDMKYDLVGNYEKGMLHGGAIASVIDLTGGIIAQTGALKYMEGLPLEEIARRLAQMGTIDMRVDYLRPGMGKFFIATGTIIRAGNRVAVTRTELHNDENRLIATGTGTYLVS